MENTFSLALWRYLYLLLSCLDVLFVSVYILFLMGHFQSLFIFVFSTVYSKTWYGIKPQTTGMESDHSANWPTTNALFLNSFFYVFIIKFLSFFPYFIIVRLNLNTDELSQKTSKSFKPIILFSEFMQPILYLMNSKAPTPWPYHGLNIIIRNFVYSIIAEIYFYHF